MKCSQVTRSTDLVADNGVTMPKRSSKVPDGIAAPGFNLPSTGGNALSLDDYRGKSWVFLVFMRSRL
jgi:hypothetical protein